LGTPLFYLSYRGRDGAFLSATIVESFDPRQARVKATIDGLNPGSVCTVDRINPRSVPPELIGKRLTRADFERLIENHKEGPKAQVV
jgi:hypothetical protein